MDNDQYGTGRAGRYDDIIHLPHHVSAVHPQMPLEERAAQFSPFAALTGFGDALRETARVTDEFVRPDEDNRTSLDGKLCMLKEHIKERPEVTVTYFKPDARKAGGAYETMTGNLKKIDTYGRRLVMADGTEIPVEYIVRIEVTVHTMANHSAD
ncbi:MAG: YolD-like family protein [Hungatella sp.]|nr:YolD-like family protein [Hungatella sp.]